MLLVLDRGQRIKQVHQFGAYRLHLAKLVFIVHAGESLVRFELVWETLALG